MFMVNELLVNLVNSVLGHGKRTSRGNISYHRCLLYNSDAADEKSGVTLGELLIHEQNSPQVTHSRSR